MVHDGDQYSDPTLGSEMNEHTWSQKCQTIPLKSELEGISLQIVMISFFFFFNPTVISIFTEIKLFVGTDGWLKCDTTLQHLASRRFVHVQKDLCPI